MDVSPLSMERQFRTVHEIIHSNLLTTYSSEQNYREQNEISVLTNFEEKKVEEE